MPTVRVELNRLTPNPDNPRGKFEEAGIRALAASIQRHGLLAPLVVRASAAGKYELVAGERRLRALKMLGRASAECMLVASDDLESRLLSLIENLQREDLHYLDEACAYREIVARYGITQEELARRLGRSASCVANRLRLLKLEAPVRELLRASRALSERHARALLAVKDGARQAEYARRAAQERLSVRALEALIAREANAPHGRVTRLFRDSRMFVNAVVNTVKQLNALGVQATARVERLSDRIEITVTLPGAPR